MINATIQKKIVSFLVFTFVVFFSYASQAADLFSGNEPEEYVQVRIIADQTQVSGGETVRIGLEETIYPGWHTYWKNPGDSGTPTEIEWDLSEGFEVSELEWPTPSKIPFGPLTNYGYEGQVTLLQNITIPQNIGSEPFALSGIVNLLVCHDICIPETHDVFITFNHMAQPEKDKIEEAESKLPLDVDWTSHYEAQDGQLVITTELKDKNLLQDITDIYITPEDWGAIDNTANADLQLTEDGFKIIQKSGERDLEEITELPLVVSYKNPLGENKSIRFISTPAPEELATTPAQKSHITIFGAIFFALFGGIILNLMPCVFPVLSMKALSLVNLKSKEEEKARGYGISYTAGILATFTLIGGLLLILKAGGSQIGWGFQLQNPIVILSLTYLVFIIGLNLSGLFEISAHLGKLGDIAHKLSDKSGHRGAFFTGVLATLMATPCTAPFMGAALGFALTQNAIISMIVFWALGLGLALPYLALCFIPALRSKLPRPGAWMQTFRQFLAFPMFLTAAWLVWVLSQQTGTLGIFFALAGIIKIAFIFWLLRVTPEHGFWHRISMLLIILSLIFIASTLWSSKMIASFETTGMEATEDQNWSKYNPAKLEELLAGNDPVFTNMTAAWCITCKVNEKVALRTDKIEALFAEKNIQYLKGDWTNQDMDITQYLNRFDRQGVPLYVYYGPRNEKTRTRPEPIVLPQLLTAGVVAKTIAP